jgi:hypothetical protein
MSNRIGVYRTVFLCAVIGVFVLLLNEYAAVADSSDNPVILVAGVWLGIPIEDLDGGAPGQEIDVPRPGMQGPNCPRHCDSAKTQCLIQYQKNQRVPGHNLGCESMYMTCVAKCSP